MNTTDPQPGDPTYTFDNSSPHAEYQHAALAAYLDPITTGILEQLPLPATGRYLELGAGAGSIARWLAHRVEPPGHIIATDLDPRRLTPTDTIEVRHHDLRHGPPAGGPFHLIHARLVLLHLPQRRTLLRQLAAALTPGGWLAIGEFTAAPLTVLTSPSQADAALFDKVIRALRQVLTAHGADLDWAHTIHPAMVDHGLQDVHTIEHTETWTGGNTGAHLHHINSLQTEQELHAAGVTTTELARFRELTQDPHFTARNWQFVCTRGRAPATNR